MPLDYSTVFEKKTINGSNVVTDSSNRLLSAVFAPKAGQTFTIKNGYEFRHVMIASASDASISGWETSLTITSTMVAQSTLGMRLNVRNASNASANIEPDEITFETDIPEFLVYKNLASEEYVDDKFDSITPVEDFFVSVNLISGVLNASVDSSGISLSNNARMIYFPVTQGEQYTIDKKMLTNYFRIAYTSAIPVGGASVSNYASLGAGNEHATILAPVSGYACVYIYDTYADDPSILDNLIASVAAYSGRYDDTITQSSVYLAENVAVREKVFYCGASRALKTLKAGIEEATKYMNATLHVDAGTYNLVDEFGSAYFEGLTSADANSGLRLKNNVHVIFDANSKVICNYTGSNQYALSLFSPFNGGEYGFILENLMLECSRCRYAIHDERNGGADAYSAKYKNCHIIFDNSQTNPYWSSGSCIGGGMGSNAVVEIENCILEMVNNNTITGYYHQSNDTQNPNHKFVFKLTGSYFVNGSFGVNITRTDATEDSIIMVTDNSFPTESGTDAQGFYTANFTQNEEAGHYKYMAWGNEKRN